MTTTNQLENDVEGRQHLQAIRALARDLNRREEDVRALYEEYLGGMQHEARIRNFLTLLVSRQVKDAFESRGLTTALTEPRR